MPLPRVPRWAIIGLLLAAPLAGGAQQPGQIPRIGSLQHGPSPGSPGVPPPTTGPALLRALRDLGHVEGQNLVIEWRYSEGQLDRLSALAADLVRLNVAVIVAHGPAETQAARNATRTIPIVMIAGSADPVAEGLAQSLGRPGGNITGTTYSASPERAGKLLELLSEMVPGLSRVGFLWDFDVAVYHRVYGRIVEEAARRLKLELQPPLEVRTLGEVESAFAALAGQRVGAVVVTMAAVNWHHRTRVAGLALANRLPTIAAFRQWPEAGGLMSSGMSISELVRRSAAHVDKVLKGARPADIPIEQPTKFELVVNLKTAKAIGLTIPQSVLVRADELIQ